MTWTSSCRWSGNLTEPPPRSLYVIRAADQKSYLEVHHEIGEFFEHVVRHGLCGIRMEVRNHLELSGHVGRRTTRPATRSGRMRMNRVRFPAAHGTMVSEAHRSASSSGSLTALVRPCRTMLQPLRVC